MRARLADVCVKESDCEIGSALLGFPCNRYENTAGGLRPVCSPLYTYEYTHFAEGGEEEVDSVGNKVTSAWEPRSERHCCTWG